MKPMCDWCGEGVYDIAILREQKEELLCKKCFAQLVQSESNKNPEQELSALMKSGTEYRQD